MSGGFLVLLGFFSACDFAESAAVPVAGDSEDQDGKADEVKAKGSVGVDDRVGDAVDATFFDKAVGKGEIESGHAGLDPDGNRGGIDANNLGAGRKAHDVSRGNFREGRDLIKKS